MANTYLSRTFGSGGAPATLTWTLSTWFKRSNVTGEHVFMSSYINANKYVVLKINGNNKFEFRVYNYADQWRYTTTMKFMDTSAWYHLVISFDSTQTTASERVIIYINGERITAFDASTTSAQNHNGDFNEAKLHTIGARNSADYFNGCMSDFNFISGTRYSATDFGETDTDTGEWRIKDMATLNYGTNGFRILKDGNTITDQSANSNNWTSSGAGITKTEDTPSNVFATWNPLAKLNTTIALNYGNLTSSQTTSSWKSLTGTIGASTGKYYFEAKPEVSNYSVLGIVNDKLINLTTDANFAFTNKWSYGYKMYNGTLVYYEGDGGGGQGSYGSTLSTGQFLGVAVDLDNSKLYFSINGVWQNSGDPTSGSTGTGAFSLQSGETYVPAMSQRNGGTGNPMLHLNFGNGTFGTSSVSSPGTNASGNGVFKYNVPTGYTALSTKGLNL